MEYVRSRQYNNVISRKVNTPAQIYFLHVCKKALVKATYTDIQVGAYTQGSTRSPKNRHLCIVLAFVRLTSTEYASATIRITIAVYHAATRTGILEGVPPSFTYDFWLYCTHPRMNIKILNQWRQPSGGCADIAVKQHHIFVMPVQGFYSAIVSARISMVLIEIYRVYPTRELGLKQLARPIRRTVVCYNDPSESGIRPGDNIRQIAP